MGLIRTTTVGPKKKQSRVLGFAASVFALAGVAIVLAPSVSEFAQRSLSVALFGGGCKITEAIAPKGTIESAFIASYPGSGAKMTWRLVEALTGLLTGDEHKLNGNYIGKAVTIKTHFPHEHGNKEIASVDTNQVQRAVLLLRHPKDAIPAFHNYLYERENDLPGHSTRAPIEEWIKWRNENFNDQMQKWAQHADYWLSQYGPDERLILGFEGLTDDKGGPASAKGLAAFLDQSDGVSAIEMESVPCVWEKIIKYNSRAAPEGEEEDEKVTVDSKRSGSDIRPYTEEQLDLMIKMIWALQKKYKGDKQLMPWLRSYKTIAEGLKRKLLLELEAEELEAKSLGKGAQAVVGAQPVVERTQPNVGGAQSNAGKPLPPIPQNQPVVE